MHSINRYVYRASKQHYAQYQPLHNAYGASKQYFVRINGGDNTLQVWGGVFQGFTDVRFQKASNKQYAKNNQDQREHTSNSKVPYKPSDISVTPITLYTAWHSKNNAVFRKPYLFQCPASRNIKQWDGSAVNWTIP